VETCRPFRLEKTTRYRSRRIQAREGSPANTLKLHDAHDTPEGSAELPEKVKAAFGFTPNLTRVLAGAPAALKAYLTVGEIFASTSLTPQEQETVLLSVSFENGCGYCMAAHSAVGRLKGLPEDAVAALRSGDPLPDTRLNALSRFTRAVVRERGWPSADEEQAFLGAGFTPQNLLEVLVGVTMKTLSNYANNVADTTLDEAFAKHAWQGARGGDVPAPPLLRRRASPDLTLRGDEA
jgi:AhpD family alkylhydroperoxidase